MRKLILASTLLFGFVTQVSAKTWIIVLPADYAGPKEAVTDLVGKTAMQLQPSDHLLVFAARPAVRQLADIQLPDSPNAGNRAWVKRRLGAQAAPVMHYLADLTRVSATEPPGNLMILGVIDELARNVLPAAPDRNTEILLLGSPLYFDPRDDRWSMAERFFPSEGLLYADVAKVPYSIVGRQARLRGATLHYCSPPDRNLFVSVEHEAAVRRFWSLWTIEQGGRVGTFTDDLATCARRFIAGDMSGQPAYQPKRNAKPEMQRARLPMPPMLPQDMSAPGPWIMRRDVPISRMPPAHTTGVAWVGLRWTAECDIDLHARPNRNSAWLSYANPRTDDGYLNKDWREATDQDQFEYVEFRHPIDLKATEVAINLYSGELPTGPEGVVRVWFDGKVYEAPFKLTSRSGNGGRLPMAGAAWLVIDLRKVMGIASP